MENCIESYKEMITDMKSRIQAQEQIESQYSDVLDFFEIGCKEPADQAHE
jgi:hypothetical protein